jgi:hypothetical protein
MRVGIVGQQCPKCMGTQCIIYPRSIELTYVQNKLHALEEEKGLPETLIDPPPPPRPMIKLMNTQSH